MNYLKTIELKIRIPYGFKWKLWRFLKNHSKYCDEVRERRLLHHKYVHLYVSDHKCLIYWIRPDSSIEDGSEFTDIKEFEHEILHK